MPTRLGRRDVAYLSAAYLLVLQVLFSSVLIATVEASPTSHGSIGTVQICSGATLDQAAGSSPNGGGDEGMITAPHCPACVLNPIFGTGVLPPEVGFPSPSKLAAQMGVEPLAQRLAFTSSSRLGARAPPYFS